jgi:peptide/nickel transport system substrate-binding protein
MATAERTLRVVLGGAKDDLWISNTPLGASNRAIGATLWGQAETLTRVSPSGELVPWLAERVENRDPLTWRVQLRENARFWDGTCVTASAVADAVRETRGVQRDAELLLTQSARLEVLNPLTLDIRTAEPVGHLAHALAHPQLAVHKSGGTIMTGPYRPVAFEDNHCLTLERFEDYWAGPPPLDRVEVRVLPELNDRIQALESDRADVIYGFPPESVDQLARFGEQYQVISVPTVRLVYLQLNCRRQPFDERDLREATSLAIDRARLLVDVLLGHGATAASFVPTYLTSEEQSIQSSDPVAAERLLDAIGWQMGPDGIRVKNGARLAFNLLSPAGPVLAVTPLAEGLQRQLRALGYDVRVQQEELSEFHRQTRDGTFAASMSASIALLTGDPWFLMRVRLASDGRANPGSYASARFDSELEVMGRAIDPAERRASWRRLQSILAKDVPRILLVFLPNIVVTRRGRLQNLVPHPNNEYFIDSRLSISR